MAAVLPLNLLHQRGGNIVVISIPRPWWAGLGEGTNYCLNECIFTKISPCKGREEKGLRQLFCRTNFVGLGFNSTPNRAYKDGLSTANPSVKVVCDTYATKKTEIEKY